MDRASPRKPRLDGLFPFPGRFGAAGSPSRLTKTVSAAPRFAAAG